MSVPIEGFDVGIFVSVPIEGFDVGIKPSIGTDTNTPT